MFFEIQQQQLHTKIKTKSQIQLSRNFDKKMQDNPESWKISTEERLKHNASFMQQNPLNGIHLTGN